MYMRFTIEPITIFVGKMIENQFDFLEFAGHDHNNIIFINEDDYKSNLEEIKNKLYNYENREAFIISDFDDDECNQIINNLAGHLKAYEYKTVGFLVSKHYKDLLEIPISVSEICNLDLTFLSKNVSEALLSVFSLIDVISEYALIDIAMEDFIEFSDFSDVGILARGTAEGENSAKLAIKNVIANLEPSSTYDPSNPIIVIFEVGFNFGLIDAHQCLDMLNEHYGVDKNIKFGVTSNNTCSDECAVTVFIA